MKYSLLVSIALIGAHSVHAHEGHEPTTSGKENGKRKDVEITVRDGYRHIESTGIPDHATGRFPNRGNPNTIRPQNHKFRVSLNPKVAATITPLRMHPFGVAINGIPFDPGAAEFWQRDPQSGWQYEALSGKIDLGMDQNHAHVQPTGAYHYHGLPTGLVDKLGVKQGAGQDTATSTRKMLLLGYAADGFPIYGPLAHLDPRNPQSELKKLQSSYQLRAGKRPNGPRGDYDGTFVQDWEYVAGSGDLDECNGRSGVTPEYPQETYYYVITDEFPFIPRYFRGTPDSSFFRHGPPGGRRPGGPPFGPPPGRRPPPP